METGKIIHRVKACASTNDLAKQMAEKGAAEGTVVIAAEQTQGRGTKGRAWFSSEEKGLYFSAILRPPRPDISLLPLVAGLAARESILTSCGLNPVLLWPNDIIWEKKKLGGILCESGILGRRVLYVILGIGLNISHRESDFPEEIRSVATSLKLATGKHVEVEVLIQNLCQALDCWYNFFLREKSQEIRQAFEECAAFRRGERITVLKEGGQISGIFSGLARDGALILEARGERQLFRSTEIIKIDYE